MQVRLIPVLTLLLALGWNLAGTIHADDAKSISDREACQRMKTLLPQATGYWGKGYSKFRAFPKITGTRLTPTGFVLTVDKKPEVTVAYADVQNARVTNRIDVQFEAQGHTQWIEIDTNISDEVRGGFGGALNHLAEAAHAGRICDCTGNVMDKAELDTFAQKITAWRAMANKPTLSDDVIKKRLMAEDAIEHKNLKAAVSYYDAGVALDPTWAQGWYNAALIYAEQQNYFDAAIRMKHYLILMPDAPDAASAKEKLLLWEAKAEEAGSQ
jgi:tetratricopeptide (TPR) repeat protein